MCLFTYLLTYFKGRVSEVNGKIHWSTPTMAAKTGALPGHKRQGPSFPFESSIRVEEPK